MNKRLLATVLEVLSLWLLLPSPGALAGATADPPKLRLAEVQSVRPTAYAVDLSLDPDKEDFSGTININLRVQQPTPVLWLNATGIEVKAASWKGGKAAVIPGGEDFLGLQFASPLPPGVAKIRIDYTGKYQLKDQTGIFRVEDAGAHYLLTQFEQTDARRAFPCFDEPLYKVPWQVTLHIPAQYAALSNTPVQSEHREEAAKTIVFEQTKPLPSYLVAFGAGPFEFVNAGVAGKNQVPVRIVTPKGRSGEAKYAAEVSATILSRLEDYFGVPYPFAKADMVAIPMSASFAMENTGMITYGQTIILSRPESDSEKRRRGYASVAAHEMAHQWFGDLVTTAWWNDIWLNEAFATWMSSKLLAEWKPEWNTRAEDAMTNYFAERSDSLVTARKVRQEIESKGDILNAFDSITYLKGAAVIGMFENWMGPAAFQNGVRNYMKNFAHRTATTEDFVGALTKASKKNVAEAFPTFLDQSGVPVVSVALDCAGSKPKLHLEQQRSLPLGSKTLDRQLWQIPVCWRYGTGSGTKNSCALMTQAAMDVFLQQADGCPAWVEGNENAQGFYHVQYKGDLLKALSAGEGLATLSAAEKLNLINDARALSHSGKLPAADALALATAFHADPERHVGGAALDLVLAYHDLVPPELGSKYAAFIRKSFGARARELGWQPKPGETEETHLLRADLVAVVATYGEDEDLTREARALTETWLSTPQSLDPSSVPGVLRTAAYHGDASLAEHFLAAWPRLDAQQQEALVLAMMSFRNAKALNLLYEAVLSGKLPVMPGAFLLLYAGYQSPSTHGERLKFLESHYEPEINLFTTGWMSGLAELPLVGLRFCDAREKEHLENFFKPKLERLNGAARILAQTTETVEQCIAETAVERPSVSAFLEKED